MRLGGFRFQVSSFRFQISGFRFQVSGFRFRSLVGKGLAGIWQVSGKDMARGCHTLEYGKSMARVWQHYGISMGIACLIYAKPMGGGRQKRGSCDNLSRRIAECGDKVAAAAACRGRSFFPAPVFLLFEHASLSCFISDYDDKMYRLFPR